MSKLANKKPVIDIETVDAKKFVAEAFTLPTKAKPRLQTFRLDENTIELLNELATLLAGGNKTLALKAGLAALASLPASEQREMILRVIK